MPQIVLDCGSGGTRVWRRGDAGQPPQRLPWPSGERDPILAQACIDAQGRDSFIQAIRTLGEPVLIGATAGIRHALEVGDLSMAHVNAFREALPDGCELRLLSPEEEAIYELRATQALSGEACGMLSMGGRSMQIGLGDPPAVWSLPFAAFSGRDLISEIGGAWSDRIRACRSMYEQKCADAREGQGMPLFQGRFLAVTDMELVARAAGILGATVSAGVLAGRLHTFLAGAALEFLEKEGNPNTHRTAVARIVQTEVVARLLFAPDAEITFQDNVDVSWTLGYFAQDGPAGPGPAADDTWLRPPPPAIPSSL